MRGQSEVVGALILAFMILLMLVGANIILRHQAQVIRYNARLADIMAQRQLENIVFDYRDGAIYVLPSTGIDVLAVVAYNDTSVVYLNTSRIRLPVNQWTPLITDPQLASDIFNLRYILGVVTSTGNLLTYVPPIHRTVNRTTLVTQLPTDLKVYYVGNNTRVVFSYNASSSVTTTLSQNVSECSAQIQANVSTVLAPIMVVYRGDLNISESWTWMYVSVYVRGSDGRVAVTTRFNGTPWTTNISFIDLRQVPLFIVFNNMTIIRNITMYNLGSGEASVLGVTLTSMSPSEVALVIIDYLAGATWTTYLTTFSWTRSTGVCNCTAVVNRSHIFYHYCNSSFTCINNRTTIRTGVESMPSPIYLVILDPETAQTALLVINPSTPVITSNYGTGYLTGLTPPVRLELDNRVFTVNTSTWNLNTTANITRASVNLTLPNRVNVTITGVLNVTYTLSTGVFQPSPPPQPPPPPPPPPPPRQPMILLVQDPLPESENPINMTVQIIADSSDPQLISNLYVRYSIVNVTTGTTVDSGTLNFTLQDTVLGTRYAVVIRVGGDDKYRVDIRVYLRNAVISTANVYNYKVPTSS